VIDEIRADLRHLVRELGLLDRNCFGSGFTLTQAHLLNYVKKNGSVAFSELQAQLNMDKASLSRALATLQNDGLLLAFTPPYDKRQKQFSITQMGLLRLKIADDAANTRIGELTGLMSDAEKIIATEGLRTLKLAALRYNLLNDNGRIQYEQMPPGHLIEVIQLVSRVFSSEQNIPFSLIPLSEDTPQKWWIARAGETILGAVACWQDNESWHWGRFVVDPKFRGMKIGDTLARISLKAMLRETDTLQIEARDVTVRIIQKLGGIITGDKTDFYGMPVTPMKITRKGMLSISSI
jgi:DNA-binding MarR family transcriptional regulator/predicted GNAT family N-acyltransferase